LRQEIVAVMSQSVEADLETSRDQGLNKSVVDDVVALRNEVPGRAVAEQPLVFDDILDRVVPGCGLDVVREDERPRESSGPEADRRHRLAGDVAKLAGEPEVEVVEPCLRWPCREARLRLHGREAAPQTKLERTGKPGLGEVVEPSR